MTKNGQRGVDKKNLNPFCDSRTKRTPEKRLCSAIVLWCQIGLSRNRIRARLNAGFGQGFACGFLEAKAIISSPLAIHSSGLNRCETKYVWKIIHCILIAIFLLYLALVGLFVEAPLANGKRVCAVRGSWVEWPRTLFCLVSRSWNYVLVLLWTVFGWYLVSNIFKKMGFLYSIYLGMVKFNFKTSVVQINQSIN